MNRLDSIEQCNIVDSLVHAFIHGKKSGVCIDHIIEDIEWLIERAREAEELEERVKELKNRVSQYNTNTSHNEERLETED